MRRTKQVVAMLLTVALSVTLIPTETQAARGNSKQSVADEVNRQEMADSQSYRLENSSDGQIVEEWDDWETFQIPDIIDKEEVEEKGYIGRVLESEKDLHTFVFKNSDGTSTMRVYDCPVKYVDKYGSVKDITTDIEKSAEGAYITKDNDIKTVFPRYFGQGVSLKHEDVDIKLVPRGMDNATMYASGHVPVRMVDEHTVSYTYGVNTTLEYGLTYTGFKEDIVVSEYTGQTEYEFTLKTNGLYLSEEDGSYYLVDDKGTVQATIGDIIIFTADEANNTMGSMSSVTVKDGEEYLLTIHVDADYLRDEKTVYPIRIDPTIEINYDNNGAGAIQDVTICSSTTQSGSSGSLYIGKRSGYGTCRVLMKFPTLSLSSVYSASEITSATVELRDLMCESTAANIQCYVFNGNTWAESSATWSNVSPNGYSTLLSSNSVSYANGKKQTSSHRYKFDITAAVKGWKSGTYSQAKGIMFKADSTVENGSAYNYKTFASYNRASYKPSLSVIYKSYSAVSLSMDGDYVMVGQSKAINVSKFPSDLAINWNSSDRNIATVSGNIVTGKKPGTATITATYRDSTTGSYVVKKINVTVMETIGIVTTKYYIMNQYNNEYVSKSTSTSNSICTANRNSSQLEMAQWQLTKHSDGLYSFYNNASGKWLNVSGTNLVAASSTKTTSSRFAIIRLSTGGNRDGLYLIRYGKYYVNRASDDSVYLSQYLTSNSYWSFMEVTKTAVAKNAYIYNGQIIRDIDSTKHNDLFKEAMNNCGFTDLYSLNASCDILYKYLKAEPEVFVYIAHGLESSLVTFDMNNNLDGWVTVNEIVKKDNIDKYLEEMNLSDDKDNRKKLEGMPAYYVENIEKDGLAGTRVALLLGCYTGNDVIYNDITYNLVDLLFEKGAHYVLGTTREVFEDELMLFWETFLEQVNSGESIDTAVTNAIAEAGSDFTYSKGDSSQYLMQ